ATTEIYTLSLHDALPISRTSSHRGVFCVMRPLSSPMRSTRPRPRLTRWGIPHASYFKDELPQLMTSIFLSVAACILRPSLEWSHRFSNRNHRTMLPSLPGQGHGKPHLSRRCSRGL